MSRCRRLASLALLSLMACDSSIVDTAAGARLSLLISTAEGYTVPDRYVVHVEGPTPRTVTVSPGTEETISGLLPGSYRVAVEGFVGSEVESFGETSVTVAVDQVRRATVSLGSFAPQILSATPNSGTSFDVEFATVQGATGYLVEWDANPSFANVSSQPSSSNRARISTLGPGTYSVRVRAVSTGNPGIASGMVSVNLPKHRWGFNENGGPGTVLRDDGSGKDALLVAVGANNSTAGEGMVTLDGGAREASDYISLPGDILSGLTDATIELWVTRLPLNTGWSRLLDFGRGPFDSLMMSWDPYRIPAEHDLVQWWGKSPDERVESANTMIPYDPNIPYHIVMTLTTVSSNTDVSWYKDGVFKGEFSSTHRLSDLHTNLWLGRSQFERDDTSNAAYHELRIYDVVLSDEQIRQNHAAGPDGN